MAYPTTTEEIGGKGGNPFSFTGEKNGASLEKIWVREGEHEIKGVKVWLSDGRIEAFGKQSGSHEEYVFSPGECFTSLSLWGNGKGTHLGAIKFKTNKGGKFVAKMTGRDLKKEFPIDVGSGFCLGVVGRSSSEINSMGFMFLNAVESAVLTDISYPTINQLIPNVETEEIKSTTLENNSFVKQVKTVETSKKVIKTSSWSITKSFSSTFSMEVKAGIPELFEVSTGLSVSVGMENTHGLEQTIEKNETFSSAVEIPPQKKMKVKMTIGRASFDLPYTGTVKITCKNGSVLEYQTKGQYKGVAYTEYKVNTTESDL